MQTHTPLNDARETNPSHYEGQELHGRWMIFTKSWTQGVDVRANWMSPDDPSNCDWRAHATSLARLFRDSNSSHNDIRPSTFDTIRRCSDNGGSGEDKLANPCQCSTSGCALPELQTAMFSGEMSLINAIKRKSRVSIRGLKVITATARHVRTGQPRSASPQRSLLRPPSSTGFRRL